MAEFIWVKKYSGQADTFPDELLRAANCKDVIAPSSASILMNVRAILLGEVDSPNLSVLIDACVERARVSPTFRPHFEDAVRALEAYSE